MKCLSRLSLLLLLSALLACESSDEDALPGVEREELADLKVYRSDSPYADVMKQCATRDSSDTACTLGTLPLIGMNDSDPDIDTVMSRLLVSHDWMGERFEELLNIFPDELLRLFRGVTAIVIDDDIRPAFYTAATGAIYLDPNYLWLSVEEAGTINPKDDFRSGYSDPLSVRILNRYVKDGDVAYRYYPPDSPTPRALSDIEYLVASLLLHELAHANDFFPPALHTQLDPDLRPWPAASSISSSWISTQLDYSNGLSSQTMFDLADVMFKGDTASDAVIAITPEQAAAAFDPDGASDDYAYSSQYEDIAMLFEETMLLYLHGIERDLAFTTAPGATGYCDEYVIAWGTRVRLSEPQVAARAEFVANQMLPEIDFDAFFRSLPETQSLPEGVDWCTSLYWQGDTSTSKGTEALREKTTASPLPPTPFHL